MFNRALSPEGLGAWRWGRQVSQLSACHHAVSEGHMRPGPKPGQLTLDEFSALRVVPRAGIEPDLCW